MNARRLLAAAAIITCVLAVGTAHGASGPTAPAAAKDGWQIGVAPDHEDGVYTAGEKVRFLVSLTREGVPVEGAEVRYELAWSGGRAVQSGTVALSGGEGEIDADLPAPGCLAVVATHPVGDGQVVKAEAGIVVDPLALRPALPAPDDFDEFWAEQKSSLTRVPMNARLTPVEAPPISWGPELECFDVRIDCPGGSPVSGYLARPKGAGPRSLPASLSLHGAGVHSSSLSAVANAAKRGRLALDINAHGLPNGQPKEYYRGLLEGELRGYGFIGMDSRETCYFLGMYLRVVRALQFLTSQPEWDGRTLVATGSSQGGAQAIVAAGLDERVTIVSAGLPALCDLAASAAGRPAGWPIGRRELSDDEIATLRYFDVCHFAARTKATAVVRVGLVDHTCWPWGVLAACNQLRGEKHLLISPWSGHSWTPPEEYRKAQKVLSEVIAAATARAGTVDAASRSASESDRGPSTD
jgi:cephalosporin-C deacetylase